VRLLPTPFSGVVDDAVRRWLVAARADTSPDELGIAFQYVKGASAMWTEGVRIAGDAGYRLGADFNDYLGIAWQYGDRRDAPESRAAGSLDCSGYVRLVLGYRLGLPMSLDPAPGMLPRRATDQLTAGPGTLVIANAGVQVTQFDQLRPGDLVFFDASSDDGTTIDHDGIYVGVDTNGDRRFISSRQGADGPTMGDEKGPSTVNGSGYWALAFRAVRRP
jgi:cell wall-associated NlpC family hydrolase